MTRKEAIQALKMMKLTDVHPFLHWEEMLEVRDMAISALQEQEERRWIPVTERIPEKQGKYLFRYGFGENKDYLITGCLDYNALDKYPHWQHASVGLFVTNWMPLPEPPKEDAT